MKMTPMRSAMLLLDGQAKGKKKSDTPEDGMQAKKKTMKALRRVP